MTTSIQTKELNEKEPHLRDLQITVDGQNVVDVCLNAPGAWVPRFTLQLSGDQGLDEKTGQRVVYKTAGLLLHNILIGDNTFNCGVFFPHANIDRDDLSGDTAVAVETANKAIAALSVAFQTNDSPFSAALTSDEGLVFTSHALVIGIKTIDFDLVEKSGK